MTDHTTALAHSIHASVWGNVKPFFGSLACNPVVCCSIVCYAENVCFFTWTYSFANHVWHWLSSVSYRLLNPWTMTINMVYQWAGTSPLRPWSTYTASFYGEYDIMWVRYATCYRYYRYQQPFCQQTDLSTTRWLIQKFWFAEGTITTKNCMQYNIVLIGREVNLQLSLLEKPHLMQDRILMLYRKCHKWIMLEQ